MVPTAVATCAALGVGGSPKGVILNNRVKEKNHRYEHKIYTDIDNMSTKANHGWLKIKDTVKA